MKKNYTPSMSQFNVTKLDTMRGRGDVGKVTNPSNIERKQPWYVPTPVHKRDEIAEQYEPEADPSQGQPDQEVELQSSDEEETEKSMNHLKGLSKFCKSIPMEEEESEVEKADWGMDSSGRQATHTGQVPKMPQPAKPKFSVQHLGTAKQTMASQGIKPVSQLGMGKALNSKSFKIFAPNETYDPYGVYRSALTIPSATTSRLPKPEGFAPAVRDTLQNVAGRDKVLNSVDNTLKSCVTHGITYKSSNGCYPCTITKSMNCLECGATKNKGPGGKAVCSRHPEG